MHHRPDYPIVERKLSRVRERRRSRRPGHSARSSHGSTHSSRKRQRSTARPPLSRNAVLGLAALCLVAALLFLAFGAKPFLHAPPHPASDKVGALEAQRTSP